MSPLRRRRRPSRPVRANSGVLVVSPSTQGGSWRWIEECVEAAGNWASVCVVAYGRPDQIPSSVKARTIVPWVSYEKVGLWLARNLWAIPLYNVPLVVSAYAVSLARRPRVVLANGLLLAAALAPLTRLTGCEVALAYHSYSSHFASALRKLLGKMLAPVRVAFVNSPGSELDLASVMESARICRVDHWAHATYFLRGANHIERESTASGHLRVLYVGRLDDEKVRFLLEVLSLCADDPICFTLVGDGPLAGTVRGLESRGHLRYRGYIVERNELAELYLSHDVLWGMADQTYVAKPVVEALACGTPSVIPDRPAVDARTKGDARIPSALLSPPIGFIVDGDDPLGARQLLLDMQQADRTSWPERCRSYAAERHSPSNADPVVQLLRSGS